MESGRSRPAQSPARRHSPAEQRARVGCPADLIVYKAFAGRPLDWADVESVIARQRRKLDWDFIFGQLIPLAELKEHPEIVTKLNDLRRIVEEP